MGENGVLNKLCQAVLFQKCAFSLKCHPHKQNSCLILVLPKVSLGGQGLLPSYFSDEDTEGQSGPGALGEEGRECAMGCLLSEPTLGS